MKRWIWIAAVLTLAGCNAKPSDEAQDAPSANPTAQPETASGSGTGVNPTNPAVGGVSPVTGSEGVAGSGSGVGQAAKDKAKQVGGGSTVDRMPAADP